MSAEAAAALRAALEACALVPRHDLARLQASGPDFLDLLDRLSTGAVRSLEQGRGAATVLTTPKGRIVDRLFVHRGREGALVVGSPGRADSLLAHLARYTFAEDTRLRDATCDTSQWALVGPRARDAAGAAGLPVPGPLGLGEGTWVGVEATVLGEDGLSTEGVSLVVARQDAPAALAGLLDLGVPELSPEAAEAWRILRDLPGPAELDEERNPLEAGLWDAVSFTKGCYVGQEVVARLKTYDKVVRARATLSLAAGAGVPARGAEVLAGERSVGVVTSAALPPGADRPVAMGYLRREAAGTGSRLEVRWADRSAEATVLTASPARAA